MQYSNHVMAVSTHAQALLQPTTSSVDAVPPTCCMGRLCFLPQAPEVLARCRIARRLPSRLLGLTGTILRFPEGRQTARPRAVLSTLGPRMCS